MHQKPFIQKHNNHTQVYLATDSEDMVQRIAREPDYTWIYMNESRANFNKRLGWVEHRLDFYNKEILFTAVADMAIVKYGDIFLGGFTSHFSKVLTQISSFLP